MIDMSPFMGMPYVSSSTTWKDGHVVSDRKFCIQESPRCVSAEIRTVNDRVTRVYVEWSMLCVGQWRPVAWITTKTISEMRRALVECGHRRFGSAGGAT